LERTIYKSEETLEGWKNSAFLCSIREGLIQSNCEQFVDVPVNFIAVEFADSLRTFSAPWALKQMQISSRPGSTMSECNVE